MKREITVKVCDLPEGYYKGRLSEMVVNSDVRVWVVAEEGSIGDWAAYIGWPQFNEIRPECRSPEVMYYTTSHRLPEDVMALGDKLSREEAVALFPDFNDLCPAGYRH